MAETLHGVVKWFNDAKGFGFIEHESGKDVFVHYSVIEWDGFKTLKDGEEVSYELKEGEKGLHAARVSRPVAAMKKAEKMAAEEQEMPNKEPIAPKLESGEVNTGIKPAAAMIEVERQERTATNNAFSDETESKNDHSGLEQ
jgi:CspA family cold shock protein